MKTQKKDKKFSKILVAGIIAAAFISAGLIYWFVYGQHLASDQSLDSSSQGPTQEEREAEEKQAAEDKQEFLDNEASGNGTGETTTPNITDESLSFSVSQSDASVTVITKITDFSGTGTCTISLSKPGETTVTQSAEILYQPEFSSCAGFSIDKAQLSPGAWNITLTTNVNGTDFSKSITYTVQ